MEILKGGQFSLEIGTEDLAKGLRPYSSNPRNNKFLTDCNGAIGLDGVLQVIDDLDTVAIDTSAITDGFPYPQIFVFTNLVIVCGETKVYELLSGSLTLKITVSAGELWSAVDFYDYIYMSNETVAVTRAWEDGTYSTVTDPPVASAICDLNGQVMIGDV